MKTEWTSLRKRITEEFRSAILTGKLKEGDFLPSSQELAKRFKTGEANIHRALSFLVKEGLISRRQRAGTIVNSLDRSLRMVALYAARDVQHPANNYTRLLLAHLTDEFAKRGVECLQVNENAECAGLKQLHLLAETRQIQGVVSVSQKPRQLEELSHLAVPFSCVTMSRIANKIEYDLPMLGEKATMALARQGCKRIGIISSYPHFKKPERENERQCQSLFNSFSEHAAKAGLELRDEWIFSPRDLDELHDEDFDRFSYRSFKNLWAQTERPDGLFVCTDDLIHGTLLAILQERVAVPSDLKLAFHKNRENGILCPLPCIFVECGIAEAASGLIQLLVAQFDGKDVHPVKIGFQLRNHSDKED